MIPPCLTLSNIRYISRVKWSNPGKVVVPSLTPWCCSYWKGSLLVTSTMVTNFYMVFKYWILIIFKQIYLTHRWDLNIIVLLCVRMDLEVMAVKGNSTFPRAPELQSHHQMQDTPLQQMLSTDSKPCWQVYPSNSLLT